MGFNEINLSFNYKGFDVNFNIENDKAYYNIDTPSRYDGLDENVEYEEKKYDISPCDNFLSLDNYLNYIVDLIETIKVDINQFSNNIIVGIDITPYSLAISENLSTSIFTKLI